MEIKYCNHCGRRVTPRDFAEGNARQFRHATYCGHCKLIVPPDAPDPPFPSPAPRFSRGRIFRLAGIALGILILALLGPRIPWNPRFPETLPPSPSPGTPVSPAALFADQLAATERLPDRFNTAIRAWQSLLPALETSPPYASRARDQIRQLEQLREAAAGQASFRLNRELHGDRRRFDFSGARARLSRADPPELHGPRWNTAIRALIADHTRRENAWTRHAHRLLRLAGTFPGPEWKRLPATRWREEPATPSAWKCGWRSWEVTLNTAGPNYLVAPGLSHHKYFLFSLRFLQGEVSLLPCYPASRPSVTLKYAPGSWVRFTGYRTTRYLLLQVEGQSPFTIPLFSSPPSGTMAFMVTDAGTHWAGKDFFFREIL